ncbi:hypothetical protein EMCG_06816 [[Emmonsia] crescens]|uniref:Rhodanese domain-containing protein n=1 Tax=[Emmonsia] crescens TaxID=73230 RepID=A0A0G2IAG1_9EURO|nr:hypothetical protein EMCG_06816 [Emmonsia crescens UAMH 3008]
MSAARSLSTLASSSSTPRLTCQLLRTATGAGASSRLLVAGVGRRQAQSQLQRGLVAGIRNYDNSHPYTSARWFSTGGIWRQNAAADADAGQTKAKAGDEFKNYRFEEITASLPTTTTTSSTAPRPSPILIDVREPSELLSTGIIPTAQNIPIRTQPDALFLPPDEFLTRFGFAKPDADTPPSSSSSSSSSSSEAKPDIVFYCKAGVRARAMALLAVQAGYDKERLGVYDGSWLDWEKRGGPVERWEGAGEE